jgi:hypothetical protein
MAAPHEERASRDFHYPIAGICVCCGVIWPCYAAPAMPYRIELPVPRQRDAESG